MTFLSKAPAANVHGRIWTACRRNGVLVSTEYGYAIVHSARDAGVKSPRALHRIGARDLGWGAKLH